MKLVLTIISLNNCSFNNEHIRPLFTRDILYFFLGILEADKIDQSYGNRFKKGRILFTQSP